MTKSAPPKHVAAKIIMQPCIPMIGNRIGKYWKRRAQTFLPVFHGKVERLSL
jgi:hypothetical protein